jgi:hypothetical protein
MEDMRARYEAASTPAARLSAAYDWLRAAHPSDAVTDAVARQIASAAERLDERAAGLAQGRGRVAVSDSGRDGAVQRMTRPTCDPAHARAREDTPSDRPDKAVQTGRRAAGTTV